MKILTVIGARPQFIKAATVSRALIREGINEVIVHTGQHFDPNMSDVFFREMEIPSPDYHLDIHGLTHGAMTGRMLEQIEKVLLSEKPDKVLVYGDTNSTLAGALAAVKCHIPVAHVEAGLRSFNMRMPEEVNRILTDRISQYLFCPTHVAVDNLHREGYQNFGCHISQPGDVMLDAARHYAETAKTSSRILENHSLGKGNFVLATLHRAENTDDPARLRAVFSGLETIHENCRVILPLHPRTRQLMDQAGIRSTVNIIPPVGYFDMLMLLKNCQVVVTDSGGLQKEAYFFGKRCITLRDETEWTELVKAGVNELTGADASRIQAAYLRSINQPFNPQSLYGEGDAAKKIAASLKNS